MFSSHYPAERRVPHKPATQRGAATEASTGPAVCDSCLQDLWAPKDIWFASDIASDTIQKATPEEANGDPRAVLPRSTPNPVPIPKTLRKVDLQPLQSGG